MSQSLRAVIATAFDQIAFEGQSAQSLRDRLFDLDPQQKAYAQQTIYGCARHIETLTWWLEHHLEKPVKRKEHLVQSLLITSLYQLKYLSTPNHAVISEAVEAAKQLHKDWASGLINALLRKADQQADWPNSESKMPLNVQHQLPIWLLKRLKNAWPKDWQQIAEQSNQQPPLTLRVNQRHPLAANSTKLLSQAEISHQSHPVIDSCIKLDQPRPVSAIPEFDTGLFSVQDLAAQLAAFWLPLKPGQRVLDACAAPGGKTAHLLERYSLDLTALDIDASRAEKIQQNLQRLNLSASLEVSNALDFQPNQPFDAILLDAPCSATGVIRRQPDIKLHRRDEDIYPLVLLQRQLLDHMWRLLKPGGYLMYATCSILPDENAKQIKRFLRDTPTAECLSLPVVNDLLYHDNEFGRQLFPNSWHDGFFYSLLRKVPD